MRPSRRHTRSDDRHRDEILGRRLEELDEPQHGPGYWDALEHRLEAARAAAPSSETPEHVSTARKPVRLGGRRAWRLVAAAAAAAAAVAVVALFGLPGVVEKTGPPAVEAEPVVAKALRALASARTLTADYVSREFDRTGSTAVSVERFHIVMRGDGSSRATTILPPDDGDARETAYHFIDTAYDAGTGIHRMYQETRSAESDGRSGMAVSSASKTVGCAIGEPDREQGTTLKFAAFAAALRTARDGRARAADFEGRPAWVVSCRLTATSASPLASDTQPTPPYDRLSVTIDKATGMPVRVRLWSDDILRVERRLENVVVNADLPAHAFRFSPPLGVSFDRRDDGFRLTTLDELRARSGGALLPGALPAGYRLAVAATAARSPSLDRRLQGSSITALRYARGFDALTITTRDVRGLRRPPELDPFLYEWVGAPSRPDEVLLTSGAFAGATARVLVAPLTVPHLWVTRNGTLLTVGGAAGVTELVAIAESMEVER